MGVQAVLGGELAWVADNDPGAATILAYRFPSAPNLGDIATVDWATVEPVDVMTAGFPCQDVSAAGKRAGLRRGTRSGVWHEVCRAIAELRPPLVVIENVRGLLTARGDEPSDEHLAAEAARDAARRLLQWLEAEHRIAAAKGDVSRGRRCATRTACVLGYHRRAVARCQWHERRLVRAVGTVLGSLAEIGFDAQWTVVSAADAGSCHGRERVFIVAWPAADAQRDGHKGRECAIWQVPARRPVQGQRGRPPGGGLSPQDPHRPASGERRLPGPSQAPGRGPRADAGGPGGARTPADTERDGRPGGRPGAPGAPDEPRQGPWAAAAGRGPSPAADADSGRGDRIHERLEPGHLAPDAQRGRAGVRAGAAPGQANWGTKEPAIRRWESTLGRPAPSPTEPGRTGERLSPRFVEWMMGLPEGWVTAVPGLSRNTQIKALGNGCVPQQVALALRLLLSAVTDTAISKSEDVA